MNTVYTNKTWNFQSLETFRTTFPIIGKLVYAVLASCMFSMTASAETYTVTQITDDGTGTTIGSLSWAITQANASTMVDDTIAFNLVSGDTVTLSNAQPTITDSVSIDGINAATGGDVTIQVEIPGVSASRVFDINATDETVSINNLVLKGGDLGPVVDNGGAVNLSAGNLTISYCVLQGAQAYLGGAMAVNGGTATLVGCTLNFNSSTTYGGALYVASGATAVLTDCMVDGNSASSAGGGIYNNGTMIVSGCTIYDNTATGGTGGGMYGSSGSSTYVINSTFSGNATSSGGGYYGVGVLCNVTLSGNTATSMGGGVCADNGLYMLNCISINNTATFSGNDVECGEGTLYAYYCWYNGVSGSPQTQANAPNVTTAYTSGDLGVLGDNGGLTYTMALSDAAPAAGTGAFAYYNETDGFYFVDNAATSHKLTDWATSPTVDDADKITTDQRGVTRATPSSMGAYNEAEPTPLTLVFDTTMSTGTTVGIPMSYSVNVTVDWGDGSNDTYSVAGVQTHTYTVEGCYTAKVSGTLARLGYMVRPLIPAPTN